VCLSRVTALSKGSQVFLESDVKVVEKEPCSLFPHCWQSNMCLCSPNPRVFVESASHPRDLHFPAKAACFTFARLGCCQYQRTASQVSAEEVEEKALPVLVFYNSPKITGGQGRSVGEQGGLKGCWNDLSCPWGEILHLRKDPALCFLKGS